MKTFIDAKNRTWKISLNLRSVLKIKEEIGVDILNLGEGEPPLLERLCSDMLFLGNVIAVLIRPQMEAAGTTEDDVLESFDPRTMNDAQTAFMEELKYFFTEMKKPHVAEAIRKQEEIVESIVGVAKRRIESFDVQEELKRFEDSIQSGDQSLESEEVSE